MIARGKEQASIYAAFDRGRFRTNRPCDPGRKTVSAGSQVPRISLTHLSRQENGQCHLIDLIL